MQDKSPQFDETLVYETPRGKGDRDVVARRSWPPKGTRQRGSGRKAKVLGEINEELAEWLRAEGISYTTIFWWRRKLSRHAALILRLVREKHAFASEGRSNGNG